MCGVIVARMAVRRRINGARSIGLYTSGALFWHYRRVENARSEASRLAVDPSWILHRAHEKGLTRLRGPGIPHRVCWPAPLPHMIGHDWRA